MTTTTPDTIAIGAETAGRRPSSRFRFLVAFGAGLFLAFAVGAGALYAYDQQYLGRVLPGVRVGGVDVSGLDRAAAADLLRTEYASLGEGEVVLIGPEGQRTISFGDFGREADVEAMVTEALAIGRTGNPVERVIADARTALRGAVVEPRVTFDPDALAAEIGAFAAALERKPRSAWVVPPPEGESKYEVVGATVGRSSDPSAAISEAVAAMAVLDAPTRFEVTIPVADVEPRITTLEAVDARAQADRLTSRLYLSLGDKDPTDDPFLSATKLRSWVSIVPTVEGGLAPRIDTSALPAELKRLAKKIDRAAVNASFKTSGGQITGVTPSKDGRKLDLKATATGVEAALAARVEGTATNQIDPKLRVVAPVLTTAEAKAARPKMRKISTWTTYFPISEKNGFGANIWIPARLINGYVVPPRGTFDFWDAVGPVTRAKGYKSGGAIINGRTEPQGALAGGICSCSTTLFNAALRAGYEMGARRNHYYYIDRYPLGLDATVFISGSGSKQTMSFTNDTDYPLLIRGVGWREGGAGYVRFDIYSVPTGRKVSFSRPTVRNVRRATDTIQRTSSLRPGQSKRIEYPVDGKQVWVTRTVRDRQGDVIHRDEYFSNYARITGITLVGRAAD